MSAFRSACFHTTRRSRRPLVRASFTNSLSSTSSMLERRSRTTPALIPQPSTIDGST